MVKAGFLFKMSIIMYTVYVTKMQTRYTKVRQDCPIHKSPVNVLHWFKNQLNSLAEAWNFELIGILGHAVKSAGWSFKLDTNMYSVMVKN